MIGLLFAIASVAGPGTPQAPLPRPAAVHHVVKAPAHHVVKTQIGTAAVLERPAPKKQTVSLEAECTKKVVTFHGCVFYMPGIN